MNQTPTKLFCIQGYTDVQEYNIDRIAPGHDGEMRVYVSRSDGKWRTSSAHKLSDVEQSPAMAFSPEELQPELERRHELYDLKEGQIHCQYCHKATDEDKAISYRVISYRNYGPGGRLGKYCSKQCASYDQMAHEG